MAARNASWTKAATVIALILQVSFIIAAFVFFVLIFHVIINPDTVSGKPISIYFPLSAGRMWRSFAGLAFSFSQLSFCSFSLRCLA